MVDPARRGPLDEIAAPRGAVVTVLPPCTRFVLRGRPAAIARAGEVLGMPLPQTACRSATGKDLAALWLGPDEWLLLADDDAFAQRLADKLAGLPHALVDVSHRHAALEVSGPGSADLLSTGCPLDLAAPVFPLGACTRTVLGKIEVILWRTGERRFRVETGRSFAAYAWALLDGG